MKILAIDPGTTQSAYCVLEEQNDVYDFGPAAKVDNETLLRLIGEIDVDALVVEHMESRHCVANQVIGAETYETCIWIGCFKQAARQRGIPMHAVYRSEERKRLVPTKRNRLPAHPDRVGKSADAQIRATLIRRFARSDLKNGRGTSKLKDVFYGFANDMWSAAAIGVVFFDRRAEERSQRRIKASAEGVNEA